MYLSDIFTVTPVLVENPASFSLGTGWDAVNNTWSYRFCGFRGARSAENSYEPLARVDSLGSHADVYWYHTEINGLPDALTDKDGKHIWQGRFTTWGSSRGEYHHQVRDVEQNLRFQGQYLDRETGLHYNTFRYYDPTGGCYTQMDPIGLLGGLNTYAYVPDPLTWIDPLGLTSCQLSAAMEKNGTPRPANSAAHHIVGETSRGAESARNILKKHDIDINGAQNGVFLPNRNNTDGMAGILHNGRHPNDYLDAVNTKILSADRRGGKDAVLAELENIRNILSSANRNANWKNVLGEI